VRTFSRRLFPTPSPALCEITFCLALCSLLAAFWRRQLYSGSTCFRETNGDRLLWRSGAVFAFANMFHFFANKLARLCGRRFAFALVFACAFNCFFFWHNKTVSPLTQHLDVTKTVTRFDISAHRTRDRFAANQLFLVSRRFLIRSWAALISVY
jgi:hypothetical protein